MDDSSWTEVRFEWIPNETRPMSVPPPPDVTMYMPFIPREGEKVVVGDIVYQVRLVMYDLDRREVLVRYR